MSIAVLGEALIDLIVGKDGAYRPHLGGSPYNVAIGLARQGIPVSYLSVLSDDCFGDKLFSALTRENVAVPIGRRSLWPTSLAMVTLDDHGTPSYRLYREGIADKDTSLKEVLGNLPDDVKLFHTGSLAITPSQLPKIRKLFKALHQKGILISIDINIRLRASIDSRKYIDGVKSLLDHADIVKASDEDLDALSLDADPRTAAKRAHTLMKSGLLLLTEGRGGAMLLGAGDAVEKKSYPIANVEDTVGAGDTFHSAFLASLYRSGCLDGPLDECSRDKLADAVDFACAAAAINVSRKGCSPPSEDEVREFIAATRR